jgi:hypothetical protein
MGTEEDLRAELLFDRIMWRRKGQAPSPEAWHRDVTAKPPRTTLCPNDVVLGGWTNLDQVPQYFSCAPGTHLKVNLFDMVNTGFAKIPTHEHAIYRNQSTKVVIPSGHCILFFQHLVHEVVGGKADHDMCRMFHGIRLTQCSEALFRDDYQQRRVFEDQAVPRLPSFQLPPMYSANHGSLLLGLPNDPREEPTGKFYLPGQSTKTNPIWWSHETFHRASLEEKIRRKKGHPEWDRRYTIVRRHMRSLAADGYALYPAYSAQERSYYAPQLLLSLLSI